MYKIQKHPIKSPHKWPFIIAEKGWACRMKVNATAAVGCWMGKEYYQGTRSMYGVIFESGDTL